MVVYYNISAKVGIFSRISGVVYRFYLLMLRFAFHYERVAIVGPWVYWNYSGPLAALRWLLQGVSKEFVLIAKAME